MYLEILDHIKSLLTYTENKPLVFTQLFFWGFFFFVLLFYSFLYKQQKLKILFLFAVSLFFYYKTSGLFICILLLTIISDYFIGKSIHNEKQHWKRKGLLILSIFENLSVLIYFKYAYFFTESYNSVVGTSHPFINHFAQFTNYFAGTHYNINAMIMPIGISFFTFQSLSYTFDIYRKKIEPVKNIFDYGFFVCFFPHLVAGPIVKAHEFVHQIYSPYRLSKSEFGIALFFILNGLSKKIIADYLALNFIDRVFDAPNFYSGLECLFALVGYSMQIYLDFSGYTDIAIALALLLGYRLKMNFNSPYKAQNTSEFWKRWHISLSSWLQNYLYIPLGGNRKGTWMSFILLAGVTIFLILLSGRMWVLLATCWTAVILATCYFFVPRAQRAINTNINLMVTMLLGGLWHGASVLFIIWGGLNGLGLIIHKIWKRISPWKQDSPKWMAPIFILLTFLFITFTRLFFRSKDFNTVLSIYDRFSNHGGWDLMINVMAGYWKVFLFLLFCFIMHYLPETWKEKYRSRFAALPIPIMVLVACTVIFLLYQILSAEAQPFIYFQF
jgi:alginate O-acetyltransferase complex protein AlgI